MPSFLVVLAMKALVAFHGISSHLIWPFKVWLVFYFFQDLLHGFLKYSANYLSSNWTRMPSEVSLGSVTIISVWPEISLVLRDYLNFPFSCRWSSSTHLYSSIRSISWRTLLIGFLVSDFLKSCLAGRPTLKSSYGHVIKVFIYLVKHLPKSIRIRF